MWRGSSRGGGCHGGYGTLWPLLLLSLQHVRWWSMCGPKCCLAHGRCSQCEAVVMKGGDSDGDGGGGRVVFVFGYKLCLCLVMSSGWDWLDQSFVSLEISEIVRDWRLDHSCGLWWSWEFLVLGSLGLVQSWSFFQSWEWTSQGGSRIKKKYLGSNFLVKPSVLDLPTYIIRHISIYRNMTSSLWSFWSSALPRCLANPILWGYLQQNTW